MVRALSNINPGDIERPTTSSGPVEYEQNFLYHESSPEGKNYFKLFKCLYNIEQKSLRELVIIVQMTSPFPPKSKFIYNTSNSTLIYRKKGDDQWWNLSFHFRHFYLTSIVVAVKIRH